MCVCIYITFIIGMTSCVYGGQNVPQSVICRLEDQDISRSLKVWESGASVSKGRRRWVSQSSTQWSHLSAASLFSSCPQRTGWCPPARWGCSFFSLLIHMQISHARTVLYSWRGGENQLRFHSLTRTSSCYQLGIQMHGGLVAGALGLLSKAP